LRIYVIINNNNNNNNNNNISGSRSNPEIRTSGPRAVENSGTVQRAASRQVVCSGAADVSTVSLEYQYWISHE
jgi:hypothetical protein